MAKTAAVKKAWRSLTWLLVIILGLTGLLTFGVFADNASWAPKLGLDLEGGTEIILQPIVADGTDPTSDQLTQAADIIQQRVDAGGLTEAQVQVQGGRNIIVTIPGTLSDQMRDLISSSAKLEFRAVLYTSAATNSMAYQAASTGNSALATASPSVSPTADTDIPVGSGTPSTPSDLNWVDADLKAQYDSYDCSTTSKTRVASDPNKPLVTCGSDGLYKYLLGPVDRLNGTTDGTLLDGETLTDATAGLQSSNGVTTNKWGCRPYLRFRWVYDFRKRDIAHRRALHAAEPICDCPRQQSHRGAVGECRDPRWQGADLWQLHARNSEDPRQPA